MNDTIDDKQLLQGIAQKDAAALEKLYDRYEKVIYSFAYRMVKDSMAAEEVVQELFLRIWHRADRFDITQGKPSTWMFAMTRNLAIDLLRKRSARAPHRPEEPERLSFVQDQGPGTEDIVELRLIGQQVREVLQELSEDQQQVVDLIYYQGLTQQEVSETASIPLGTVKSRVRLAMKQLRQRLSHWGRREHVHD